MRMGHFIIEPSKTKTIVRFEIQWDKATEFILRSREVHDEVSKVK